MGLETATYIDALVTSNPDGADARSTADDHLRLIKAALKRSFPQVGGAVSASAVALSYTNDLSASAQAQLNALRDGSHTAKVALVATTCISASSAAALAGVPATSIPRLDAANTFVSWIALESSGNSILYSKHPAAPTDEQGWANCYAGVDGLLRFFTTGDSYSYASTWLAVNRSGTWPTVIGFYGDSIQFNSQELTNPTQLNSVPAASYARLDVARTFAKGTGSTPVNVAYGSTISINCENGDFHLITLTGSASLAAPSAARPGQTLVIALTQGGSGSYTVTWNSVFRFAGGITPTLSTAVGARDVFAFIYDNLAGHWLQAGLDVKR